MPALTQVFAEIDTDSSGDIDIDEVMTYIVMAYMGMACIDIAYIVTAYIATGLQLWLL